MSVPIQIEGTTFFVSPPTPPDVRNAQDYIRREIRRTRYAALPDGLSDEDLKRWIKIIDEECAAVGLFEAFEKLLETIEGQALFIYSWLHHDSTNVTLDWVRGLLARCDENSTPAIEGIREIRAAINSLKDSKKNGQPEAPVPATSRKRSRRSVSTRSTSP
jgi:peptidoglycan/xylan/chitin deacetylase (PgdA/CDA1 family)